MQLAHDGQYGHILWTYFTLINFGLFHFQKFAKFVLILTILTSQRQLLGYVQTHLQQQDLQVKTQWIFVELCQINIVRVFSIILLHAFKAKIELKK